MRTIKFRAWDKLGKTMIYPDVKENTRNADYTLNAWCDSENDRSILMQLTGLYDKNEKEIFEQDIVKREDGFIGVVVYSNGSFFVKTKYAKYHISAFELEIIGNIYDNPELLET